MIETSRKVTPIKERIRQFRWELDGRQLPMGIGCAWVAEYWGKSSTGTDLLRRCYDEGFRYFDTSRSYGESELVVGDFLKHVDRQRIFLSTKADLYFRSLKERAFADFQRSFFDSFDRLGTDHIDLFLIHDTENIEVCDREVVPFLKEQQEKGLIDYIGLGTKNLQAQQEGILERHIDATETYLTYSLLKRSAASTIDLAARYDNAFINASLLHFGILKDPDPTRNLERCMGHYRRERILAAKMQALCREMNINIIDAALQYSLFNPGVDMVLNGIHRDSNIDSTIRAMRAVIYPDQWARIFALQNTDPCIDIPDADWVE